jgi:uncharacterized membrane protein
MKTRLAVGALLLSALSLPAMAQVAPFEAEVDCGGRVTPPATVPYQLRFENQTQQTIPIDVTVSIRLPTGSSITLRDATINLRPNQDRTVRQSVSLPAQAPAGSYQITIVAASADFSTFDTCSFNVN